ncbi:tRNA pseudouridine synthase [Entamoeba marina]
MDYCRMLNGILPPSIRCLGWCGVMDDFSSRFSCVSRVYHYYFHPLEYDVSRMKQAAQLFLGEHDFTNFCKKDPEVPHCNRKVLSFEIEEVGGICRFVIEGTAFLWHQVRYMVASLFLIGQGADPINITNLLNPDQYSKPDSFKYAAAYPLVLYQCKFNDVVFQTDTTNIKLLRDIVEEWKEAEVKAVMRKSLMDLAFNTTVTTGKTVKEELDLLKKKKKIEFKPKKNSST